MSSTERNRALPSRSLGQSLGSSLREGSSLLSFNSDSLDPDKRGWEYYYEPQEKTCDNDGARFLPQNGAGSSVSLPKYCEIEDLELPSYEMSLTLFPKVTRIGSPPDDTM